ncbi:MAG: dihydroorotase family protein [Euryarchaeota archaeon]|nr:dihydroorotase family protein [Euryarchaeota archaeon]
MDWVIEARAFVEGRLSDVEIGIDTDQGKIVAVKRNLPGKPRTRFPSHQILLPSGVDWHVHFRDPGHPAKEDFASGTKAAAMGGIGTVLDMPNTVPLVDRRARLREKQEAVARKACVDWGLWATLTHETRDADALLHESVGAKIYLAPTTGVDDGPTDAELRRALEACRDARRWAIVHAESLPHGTPSTLRGHDESRPEGGEVDAIARVARLAPDPAHVHIAHATTRLAVEAARAAGMSVGITPHHLLLNRDVGTDARFKVNPPLRADPARRSLAEAFAEGLVSHLESDHAPHTPAEKTERFAEAPSGMPGVETLLPLLLRAAKHGELPIEQVVFASSQRPAQALGLLKGKVGVGYDADFIVVDTRATKKLRADDLHGKCGWTAFEGRPILPILHHYQRGRALVEDGAFVGKKGAGRRIEPPPIVAATAST